MIVDCKDSIKDENLVGNSTIMANLRLELKKLTPFLQRVLILGKQGTGKSKIAKIIHDSSRYAGFPFYEFNCSTDVDIDIKLFGKEGVSPSIIEKCSPGTLFFNEICNLPISIQKQLAHTLQNQTFKRVNGEKYVSVLTRFLGSSSENINQAISSGKLEKSLYDRIAITEITLPALSERLSDIPAICNFLIKSASNELNIKPPTISDDALTIMQSYNWPMNISELKNTLEPILNNQSISVIKVDDLPKHMISSLQNCLGFCPKIMQMPLKDARKEFEKGYISMQLKRFGNSIPKTAEFIGMERSALYRKVKELNIDT